ncbi:hypothetical protein VNO80_01353 [Phaseolus coccineus]|uniref:Uncharacterized protein n=1 Tax=Phaseolus coccineus TaxID=3886 RepID=A0AAN9WWJ6_PHACN
MGRVNAGHVLLCCTNLIFYIHGEKRKKMKISYVYCFLYKMLVFFSCGLCTNLICISSRSLLDKSELVGYIAVIPFKSVSAAQV